MFGWDADYFRPERWLLEDNNKHADQLNTIRRTNKIIFGYGIYQCLSKPIAWLKIIKVIFKVPLLRRLI
ncbi:hypothetical protein BS50DRAFT_508807 [Corynespora cassiicola Philippines]|uniref:Cytochrome P450 n=1 Tax=Corynespora cassiicola Philippines TaxID=1448308 RepID=A0A2T2N1J1_CORCC|nr:hypothetical protein BS50DRAFT_508807 [Corynespora cassiicola Philippines]